MTYLELCKQGHSKKNMEELKQLAESHGDFKKLYADCVRNGGDPNQLTLISLLCYRLGVTDGTADMLMEVMNA